MSPPSNNNNRNTAQYWLDQQLEAGRLSWNDHKAASQYFNSSSIRRGDSLSHLGLLAGTVLSFAFLRFKPRSIGSSVSTSLLFGIITPPIAFLGVNAGLYANLRIKARFVRSLENPEQFTQAMVDIVPKIDPTNVDYDAIRVLATIPPTRSSWKEWASNVRRVAELAPGQGDTQDDDSDKSPVRQVSASQATLSQWDRIRAANAHSTRGSSWEALRQQHERSRLPKSAVKPDDHNGDNSREAEQARFDAMLDEERRKAESSWPRT